MLKYLTLTAVAVTALAALPANAATVLTITNNTPTSCNAGDQNCTFDIAGQVETNGAFSVTSNQFSLPGLGTFAGSATNSSAGGTDINFLTAVLTNVSTMTSYNGNVGNFGSFSFAGVDASVGSGLFTLTLTGNSTTAASGTVFPTIGGSAAFAAVPEPTAWAVFILGFGAIGGTLRRRSRNVRISKAKLNFA